MKTIVLLLTLALVACDIEENECRIEDRYISHYEEAISPIDGTISHRPVWLCP